MLVERHVGFALEVADEAMVLVHGDVSLRGPGDQFHHDPGRLEAACLGVSVT